MADPNIKYYFIVQSADSDESGPVSSVKCAPNCSIDDVRDAVFEKMKPMLSPLGCGLWLCDESFTRLSGEQQFEKLRSPASVDQIIRLKITRSAVLCSSAIDDAVASVRQRKSRDSWTIRSKATHRFDKPISSSVFGRYLLFVNRESQRELAVENFREHYGTRVTSGPSHSINQDYKVLVVAGAPGIGKTTMARYAFAAFKPSELQQHVSPGYCSAVKVAQTEKRMFHVVLNSYSEWENQDADLCIGTHLMYAYCKAGLEATSRSYNQFSSHVPNRVTLTTAVNTILNNSCETASGNLPIIVINIDEVGVLLRSERDWIFVKAVIKTLVTFARCYFVVILSSTNATDVLKLPEASGFQKESVVLPLLTRSHFFEVVKDLTVHCLGGDKATDALIQKIVECDADQLAASHDFRYLAHVLDLLAGVPRLLEFFLFALGRTDRNEFTSNHFLDSVKMFGDHTFLLGKIQAVRKKASQRYGSFTTDLQERAFMPFFIAADLFGGVFRRSDVLCYYSSSGTRLEVNLKDLEDKGLIFLQSMPDQHNAKRAVTADPECSFSEHFISPWIRETDDDTLWSVAVPYLWAHFCASPDSNPHPPLSQVYLLKWICESITPSQKEELSLAVAIFRLYYFLELNPAKEEVFFADVFPGNSGVPPSTKLCLRSSRSQIAWGMSESSTRLTKHKAAKVDSSSLLGLVNNPCASGADSFLFTDPIVYLQDKQMNSIKHRQQQGEIVHVTTPDIIQTEHRKVGHSNLFVFLTDDNLCPTITPKETQCFISQTNEHRFFGKFLSTWKLFLNRTSSLPRTDVAFLTDQEMSAIPSVNQTGNQSISQLVSQSVNPSILQSLNQSVNQLANQSASPSVNPPEYATPPVRGLKRPRVFDESAAGTSD